MTDTNNFANTEFNVTNETEISNNYFFKGIKAWWSGFSLRTKLLAIATLVVSLLMT